MMTCLSCASAIDKHDQYYIADDMGPEIMVILEQNEVPLVDVHGAICSECFANILGVLSISSIHENEAEDPTNICICCQLSLRGRRCHSLPEGPVRHIISKRISPKTIPEGGLVCHRCWTHVQRVLKDQGIPRVPSLNTYKCVWCCRSLANTRRQTIREGPERNEIIARIYPREIPLGGSVCYACWVKARRNVKRAANIEARQQDRHPGPSNQHYGEVCVWCRTSLFQRQVRNLREGPERDIVAARIYPVKLPVRALLCVDCWARAQEQENIVQPLVLNHAMCLDGEFKHTPNSGDHCFVPGCKNTERLLVPHNIRKRILNSQKIFVTESNRICAEHKTVNNWEFLVQHQFSDSFTKDEIKSMLHLSVSQDTHSNLDFDRINEIEDNIFEYWTGLTKENYFNIFNQISPAMSCKSPKTALGVYLIKARTGDSHERLSSLLGLSKTTLIRLLQTAREALTRFGAYQSNIVE